MKEMLRYTSLVNFNDIIASVDAEIETLQRARAVLSGTKTTSPTAALKPKRKMSAAGRKAIAEGQKKRWAKQMKAKKGN
jgi:hypothetical protein